MKSDVYAVYLLFVQKMLCKKKGLDTHYMGTSGKYVKKDTTKPRSKSVVCLRWAGPVLFLSIIK